MKKIKLLLLSLILGITSCSSKPDNPKEDPKQDDPKQEDQKQEEQKQEEQKQEEQKSNFEGITFDSYEITYDGKEHKIEASNVPNFATVTYTNNGPFINAGTYNAKALIKADKYNDLELTATLKILKADLTSVSFQNQTFEFDGNPHSITVTGNIPSDASVTYTCDKQGVSNSAIDVGEYNITATISSTNFNDIVLNAKLTISTSNDERYILNSGNTLYFQNAIDNDYLYAYDFAGSKLTKVASDIAKDMIPNGSNSIMYVSSSLLFSSIKSVSYSGSKYERTSVLSKACRYIQKESSSVIYFVYNGLTNENSGIYKAVLSGDEPTITLLSKGKAKYLTLNNGNLYFADGTNNYKLSKISTSSTNQTRQLVEDVKIKNLYYYSNSLYFTVESLNPLTQGNYIARYNLSTKSLNKLTCDAGIDFVFINDYLYYISTDLYSTVVNGEGVYKVDAKRTTDNITTGDKVVDGETTELCSLASYNNSLIYYEVNGYKLIKYDLSSGNKTNLLAGFVKPEDPAPISEGSQIATKDGIIYYLDLYDGKTLHSYNPTTKANFRLTSEKVDNFSIIGDYIYFNTVTMLVNNDTYRMNIVNKTSAELVNKYNSSNIVSDGTFIYYYAEAEAFQKGVAKKAIHKANMDGTNDVVIYESSADNLTLYNGSLYFISKNIMRIDNVKNVSSIVNPTVVNKDITVKKFIIYDNVIYFRQNYLIVYYRLAKMNIDGSGFTEMVTKSTDPTDFFVYNGFVYYSNSADTSKDYDLYRISINGSEGMQEKLTSGMHVNSPCLLNGKVYFIDYALLGLGGDSHLYTIDINGGNSTRVDK